jgi:alanyl-tRNA synthetase
VAAMDDGVRARSQGFVEGPGAAYLATCVAGPSYLLALSADLVAKGSSAAELMKPLLAQLGGKGGGSPALAQGKLAVAETLAELERALRTQITTKAV